MPSIRPGTSYRRTSPAPPPSRTARRRLCWPWRSTAWSRRLRSRTPSTYPAATASGRRFEEDRFGVEPELTAKVARLDDIRLFEVGISYTGHTYTQGKKIGWRDGLEAAWCILKYTRRERGGGAW